MASVTTSNANTKFAVPDPRPPKPPRKPRTPYDPYAGLDPDEKAVAQYFARLQNEPIPENAGMYRAEDMFVKKEIEPWDFSRLDDDDEDQVLDYKNYYMNKLAKALLEANKRRGIEENK